MLLVKLLSIVALFTIVYLGNQSITFVAVKLDLVDWIAGIPHTLFTTGCVLYHPNMVRNLCRLLSVDASKWEATRNELTVVRVAIVVFLVLSGLVVATSGWLLYVQSELLLLVIIFGHLALLIVAPIFYADDVADLLGIQYPNVEAYRRERDS